jgi:branched-chain amino acid transport system substrate-binding protein
VTTSVHAGHGKGRQEKNRSADLRRRVDAASPTKQCNAVTVHWTYDTYALANGTGQGGDQDRRQDTGSS